VGAAALVAADALGLARAGGEIVAFSDANCTWSPDALRTPEQLAWINGLVRHVIASQAAGHDERSAVVARWLAKRIGEGALPSASDSTIREDLRAAWRGVINALPVAWLQCVVSP
jgi:hypothetical protein